MLLDVKDPYLGMLFCASQSMEFYLDLGVKQIELFCVSFVAFLCETFS